MKKKIIAFLTSMGLLMGNAAFAYADVNADVNNTGADSVNVAKVSVNCTDVVYQSNKSVVVNNVWVSSNTGHNEANKNTGDGSVTTGGIGTGVAVANGGSKNIATSDGCCGCAQGSADATVEKTGADSWNKAVVNQSSSTVKVQKNWSVRTTVVGVKSQTGKNKANKNTGNGTVETEGIGTGVEVVNEGDTNTL